MIDADHKAALKCRSAQSSVHGHHWCLQLGSNPRLQIWLKCECSLGWNSCPDKVHGTFEPTIPVKVIAVSAPGSNRSLHANPTTPRLPPAANTAGTVMLTSWSLEPHRPDPKRRASPHLLDPSPRIGHQPHQCLYRRGNEGNVVWDLRTLQEGTHCWQTLDVASPWRKSRNENVIGHQTSCLGQVVYTATVKEGLVVALAAGVTVITNTLLAAQSRDLPL